jgi:hypothetical protein
LLGDITYYIASFLSLLVDITYFITNFFSLLVDITYFIDHPLPGKSGYIVCYVA